MLLIAFHGGTALGLQREGCEIEAIYAPKFAVRAGAAGELMFLGLSHMCLTQNAIFLDTRNSRKLF